MAEKQLDNLPAEVREQLPEGAQNIFLAAFNSAHEDGMDEQGALAVAWKTVEGEYRRGEDGTWQRKPEDTNIHHKAHPSGGN